MNNLIIWYLTISKNLKVFFYKLLYFFTNTKSVHVLHTDNTVSNSLFRYHLLQFVIRMINYLNYFKSYIDLQANAIKVVKHTAYGDKTIITPKDLSLSELIPYVEEHGLEKGVNNCIFLKFDLMDTNNTICLKNYLLQYNDSEQQHEHTLENIFKFENIEPTENSKIKVIRFVNRKKQEYEFNYKDVSTKHINFFSIQ